MRGVESVVRRDFEMSEVEGVVLCDVEMQGVEALGDLLPPKLQLHRPS
jgi:hypothetical protein